MALAVSISNEQVTLVIDEARLELAIRTVLTGEGLQNAEISLAIVDDPTIHDLNRRFLQHDYPTDVLSFVLEQEPSRLEGEVIASADTAVRNAVEFGWPPADELLLYVVHGTLHLAGYDDADPKLLATMRAAEGRYLAELGLQPRY